MDQSEIKQCLKQVRAYIQAKEFKKALRDCEKILTADKTNYFALVFAGHCCVELNDALEARKFYDLAVRQDQNQILAWQGYGQYYEKFSIYNENYCNCLRKILELSGDETKRLETKFKLVKCMSKIGESAEAFQEIKTLSNDKSNVEKLGTIVVDLVPHLQLSSQEDIEFVVNCYRNEVERCDIVRKKEKSLEYLCFLSSVDLGKEALEVSLDLVNNYPDDTDVISSFGSLLIENFLSDLNLSERYLEELDRFIEKNANNKADNSVLTCLEFVSEFLNGNTVNGLTILEEVESIKRQKYSTILLAVGYFSIGYYEKSLEFCNEVLISSQEVPGSVLSLRCEFMKNESEFYINCSKRDLCYDKYCQIIDRCVGKFPKLMFECVLGKAKCFFAAGKFSEAKHLLDECINKDLDDRWRFEVDLLLCSMNIERGCIAEAQMFIEKCLEFDDEHFLVSILLGKIALLRSKEVDLQNEKDALTVEARSHFKKAIELNPRSWEALYHIGLLQMEKDVSQAKIIIDKQVSLRCMEYARQYNSYNVDIVRKLIILYDKYDIPDKKSTLLDEFLKDKIPDQENADVFEEQADLLLRLKLIGDATSIFQKLTTLFENNCNLLSKLAQCYRLRGSNSSALLCLERCLKIEPDSLIVNFQIAQAYFDLELFAESIHKYKEILSKYGDNFSPARLALGHALYRMTELSFEKAYYVQSFDYCVEALEILLQRSEKTCLYYKLLGDFCAFLDNFSIEKLAILKNSALSRFCVISKLAILQLGSKFYVKACQLATEETDFIYDLALNLLKCYIYDKCNETLQKSKRCVEKALVLNPKRPELWSLLGCISRYGEDSPENRNFTQNCFVRALQIDERSAQSWTNLGLFYLETFPNVEIAHECFKKAQIIDPEYCNAWIGQAIIAERVKSSQAPDLFRHTTSLANRSESLMGYASHALVALLNDEKEEYAGFRYCIPSAMDAILKLVGLHPEDACALNYCGLLCEVNGQDRKLAKFNEASSILSKMKKLANFPYISAGLVEFQTEKFDEALQNYDYSLYYTKSSDDSFYVNVAHCLCLMKLDDYEKALSYFVEKIGYVDERPHAKIVLLLIRFQLKKADSRLIKECLSVLMNSTDFYELTKAVLNYLSKVSFLGISLESVNLDEQTRSWIMHKFPYLLQSRMILCTNKERINVTDWFSDVCPIVYSLQDATTISNYIMEHATQKFISSFRHCYPAYRLLIKS